NAFSVTVSAQDTFHNAKTDYTGTIEFSSTDNGSQTVLPGQYTFTTGPSGDNGTHTFTNGVTLTKTTSQTVSVDDVPHHTNTQASDSTLVTAGDLASFAWTTYATAGTSTAGLQIAAAVTAYDAYNNVKTDYHGTPFSGLANSPSGCSGPCPPIYPTFSN